VYKGKGVLYFDEVIKLKPGKKQKKWWLKGLELYIWFLTSWDRFCWVGFIWFLVLGRLSLSQTYLSVK
jgi:hypothetical protein